MVPKGAELFWLNYQNSSMCIQGGVVIIYLIYRFRGTISDKSIWPKRSELIVASQVPGMVSSYTSEAADARGDANADL